MRKYVDTVIFYINQINNNASYRNILIQKIAKKIPQILWIITMLYLLLPVYNCMRIISADCATATMIPSLFINLPLSILGLLLDILLNYFLNAILNSSAYTFYLANLNSFLYWMSMFACGYLQWFKLLPYIIKKYYSKP